MNKEEIQKNLIFEFMRGSQAYGTNNEQSDVDIGGIALPTKKVIYGIDKFEQDDQWVDEKGVKEDKVIYNITKAVKLMCEANPNILDFLYAPERVILKTTSTWHKFIDIRDEFLSIKAKGSFQGYALSQLNRIKTHKSYILNPVQRKPLREDYGLPEQSVFPITQLEVIAKISSEYVSEDNRNDFYEELNAMMDKEGAQIFKKYISIEHYPFAIADFKKGQKEFLQMISSMSGVFLKDEFNEMAQKELSYISASYNWKRYKEWEKGRNPKRAEMERKYGFDCYSCDTEFLTESGWKYFGDITKEDCLATVYIDKKSKFRKHFGIEYQKYTDKFSGDYFGSMYHFHGNHFDSLVTPNHRMLFREFSRKNNKIIGEFKLDEAHSLPESIDFLKTINPNTKNYNNKHLLPANFPITMESYLTLMGWFLSDGTFQFRKNKNDRNLKCCVISQKKGNRLQGSMKKFYNRNKQKFSVSYYISKRSPTMIRNYVIDEHLLHIRDKSIINKLYEDCGHKKNKRIPRWIFKLSKRLMEKLFDAMVRGDGTIKNTSLKSIIYYTSIKYIADDVNELAFLCGWETYLYGPYESKTKIGDCIMYQVHVNKNVNNTRRIMPLQNLEIIKPKTKTNIVCFTVPNKTLVTRRKGHISIHGNSKHSMHLIRLLKMSVEILSGKGVLVDRTNIDRDYLMDIRNGKISYDEIMKHAESLNDEGNKLYKENKNILPLAPNYAKINNILIEVLDNHFWKN